MKHPDYDQWVWTWGKAHADDENAAWLARGPTRKEIDLAEEIERERGIELPPELLPPPGARALHMGARRPGLRLGPSPLARLALPAKPEG